ncbi:Glycosyl transferases group 1 [Verrucomicrobium sp. GAS474]|uniref:glycosyltransferase family 4 protein n=1 Tax=Verrucomicrobium sp. GAS474 TaxID=1882831 RepID=UPI00087C3EEF|nr:glycosyltransferase family 1 protein [Verrucomicrobium sp. GAS474]SDU21425.1 Glycosyl transferases group 1 [Verrucomicrobium sp. GAS474]
MSFLSHARNFEDVILRRALRSVDRGFYVDIGAGDPQEGSVTCSFYGMGWRGINIEPREALWQKLQAARPEDGNYRSLPSTAGELQALCAERKAGEIHFLRIDLDGEEQPIAATLAGIDLRLLRPWVIVVRAVKPDGRMALSFGWEAALAAGDYLFVHFDGVNRFYLPKEREASLRAPLSLPPGVFDDFVRHSEWVAHEMARQRTQQLVGALQRLEGAASESVLLRVRAAVLEKLLAQARGSEEAVPPLPGTEPRQLLIDIHRLARTYRQTGIERVMAGLVSEFLRCPPEGYRTEPVYVGDDGVYRYARKLKARLRKESDAGIIEEPVEGKPGDLFLQLDLGIYHFVPTANLCVKLARQGVRLYFVVYDLLPILHRQWFLPETHPLYENWLRATAQIADGFLCISKSVASDLARWLNHNKPERAEPLKIDWFHLGADLDTGIPTDGVPDGFENALAHLKRLPMVLMVGTVEPRKGYLQTLAAFELLWKKGVNAYLVIVGKKGWALEPLWEAMEKHPEAGRRLLWFQVASDEMLLKLYETASGLLMASEGEGFGLPLIEAARHRLPILVRDLPVFREVAGGHATYFSGAAPEALAGALEAWIPALAAKTAQPSGGMPILTWDESRRQMAEALFGGKTRLQWPSPSVTKSV